MRGGAKSQSWLDTVMTEMNHETKTKIPEEEILFVDLDDSRESSQSSWMDKSSPATTVEQTSGRASADPSCDIPVASIE